MPRDLGEQRLRVGARRIAGDRDLDRAVHGDVRDAEQMAEGRREARRGLGERVEHPGRRGAGTSSFASSSARRSSSSAASDVPEGTALSVTSRGRVISDSASLAVSKKARALSSQNQRFTPSASVARAGEPVGRRT